MSHISQNVIMKAKSIVVRCLGVFVEYHNINVLWWITAHIFFEFGFNCCFLLFIYHESWKLLRSVLKLLVHFWRFKVFYYHLQANC